MQNYRANRDESLKTQKKELDLKHKQNYRANGNVSIKALERNVN